jgi:chromosome segregation ATPase
MKESLNGWALQENSKVDSLEQEREELRRSNSTLTAELSKVTTARNAAEADVELVRSELRTTRALLEHSEGEVSRLKEGGEQAREHIATLHTSLSKSEEDLKLQREDNNRWR